MLTKKDRKALITAINLGLTLYVPKEHRQDFAELIADKLEVPFKAHFLEACLADQID